MNVVSFLSLLPVGNVEPNSKKLSKVDVSEPVFYMTPSFPIAQRYAREKASAGEKEIPVVLEIFIRDAGQLMVTLFTESAQATKEMVLQKLPSFDDIKADLFASFVDKSFWQFVVRDPTVLHRLSIYKKI